MTKERTDLVGEKSSDGKEETAFQLSVRMGFEDIAEFLIDLDAKTYEENLPWKSTPEEIVKTVYPAVQGGHIKILTTLIKKGNLTCNDSRGELLRRAVKENNQSAVGFLFSKYYNHPTHGTHPVPDPQVETASDKEPDQPRLSDIKEALTAAEEQKTTIDKGIKTAEYIIGLLEKRKRHSSRLQYEDNWGDSAMKEAIALAEQMKKDYIKKSRHKDSDTAQYFIEELSREDETLQSSEDRLLDARSRRDASEMERALVLAKEKKKELVKSLQSSEVIVKKLSEEEKRARLLQTALSIVMEKKKIGDQDACRFITEELSKEYQPDSQTKGDPQMVSAAKRLSEKWKRDYKKRGETEKTEAMGFVTDTLQKLTSKKEKFSVSNDDEQGAVLNKEKLNQDQALIKKMRALAKEINLNTNKDLIENMDDYLKKFADVRR